MNPNILSKRYATAKMNKIFSEYEKTYETCHGAPYFDQVTENIEYFLENKHEDQIARLYVITNKHNLEEIPGYIEKWGERTWITCQGTHSFSVAWTGDILNCTNIPYEYNYGNVYDEQGETRDLVEIWKERNRQKLTHEACQKCNVRNPNHNDILMRYNEVWV
jgi:sulfatase maturation enzyme AslB (radical SAM superfamily)